MPLTLIARILAATAVLLGTTRGEAARQDGAGQVVLWRRRRRRCRSLAGWCWQLAGLLGVLTGATRRALAWSGSQRRTGSLAAAPRWLPRSR